MSKNNEPFSNIAPTLTEEQCEAFWTFVRSSSLISELYAVSAVDDIYSAVTPDDVRDLTRVILKQFEDDSQECFTQLREALLSRAHTVQSLIKFRVGNFAEFEFAKKYLPEHTLQRLVCQALYEHTVSNH